MKTSMQSKIILVSSKFLKHFGIFDCNVHRGGKNTIDFNPCSMIFIQLVNILDILLADILNLNYRSFTSKPSLNRISTIRNSSTSLSFRRDSFAIKVQSSTFMRSARIFLRLSNKALKVSKSGRPV